MLSCELHDGKMNAHCMESKESEFIFVQIVREMIKVLSFSHDKAKSMPNVHRLPRCPVPVDDQGKPGSDPFIARFGAMLDRDAVLNACQRMQMRVKGHEGSSIGPTHLQTRQYVICFLPLS